MNADQEFPGRLAQERISFHLNGRSIALDRRINAVRGDLADISLAGVLFAPHYAKAQPFHCVAPSAFVRENGASESRAASQLLSGETFHVLDVTGKWAWGFCEHDGYVGYVEYSDLGAGTLPATHHVIARSAPVFTSADIKSPVVARLSTGSRISGETTGDFVTTEQGAVHLRHLMPMGEYEADWVAVAEKQIGQPYVWGGRGDGGIDCSGLVQLSFGQAGVRVPRDTDLQRESIGEVIEVETRLQRGDLVFFPGHVGIMMDADHMLHANAYWMSTMVESLGDVVARLKPEHEQPVLARRRVVL